MSNLRFAVLGTGWWANYQIPAWYEVGGVELIALYNRTVTKAEKLASRYGVPHVYGDAEDLFRRESLDFVDIIAGNSAHAELVEMAAHYRVPVICQKPMAPDWSACQNMVRTCQEAGIPFLIHENLRWQLPIRAAKQVLVEGRIGQAYRARIQLTGYSPEEYLDQPFLKELDRLTMMDIGSHLLDTARFFFREAQSVYCQHRRSRADIRGEDVASVMLQMGDVICTCEMSNATRTSWGHYPDVLLFIEGAQGSIELGADYWLRVTTDEGTLARRIKPPTYRWLRVDQPHWHASMVPCNANLLNAIRTGQPAETCAEDNLKSMQLVFAAYESAECNQAIQVGNDPGCYE